ncbi:MAG: PAS domain S-box protein [Desulfuromonas sp.]|nr:PAS domain S-box protein [Desulfuromonas sp.]
MEVDLNFRVLAETIPHLVWSARPDGFRDYFNARLLAYLGKTLEEMQGWMWQEVLHPDDRQRTMDAWTEAKIRGTELCAEYRIRRGTDEAYRWHEGRATPVRDAAGNIVRWFGTCTDIEERKQSEEKLRYSEERFSKAFHCGPMMMTLSDFETGRYLEVNDVFTRVSGFDRDETIGRTTLELGWIDPENRQRLLAELKAKGRVEGWELKVTGKAGNTIWCQYFGELVPVSSGDILLSIALDITERKHAEEALALAKQAAEVASLAKSEFLANMSHEIRTPITGILGMAELLEGTELSACQQGYLKTLLTSTENLLALVNEILDLSRIEAGKVELECKGFSLREVLNEVVASQILVANAKGLPIRTVIPADVPDGFTGDQLRLKQILFNLVGNAVKFTEKGDVTLSVAVEERQGAKILLRFDVADTGIGIKPEAIARIFKPFDQADSSMTRKFGGTGLGLAICTRLSALMGGAIWVDSREGVGSTFHLRIPLEVSDTPPASGASRQVGQPPLWEGAPRRVLLVEDNDITRKLFTDLLNKYSHHVDFARNGVEALEMLNHADYDIVLMDVQMPVMDGIEAVGKLRERERETGGHVPVIAITAHAMEKDRLNILSKGFDGYLSKPTKMKDLFNEMKRCLAG